MKMNKTVGHVRDLNDTLDRINFAARAQGLPEPFSANHIKRELRPGGRLDLYSAEYTNGPLALVVGETFEVWYPATVEAP